MAFLTHVQVKSRLKPKPDNWDSDFEGPWNEDPEAMEYYHGEAEVETSTNTKPKAPATRGKGKAAATTHQSASNKKSSTAPKGGRGKKKVVEEEEDDIEEDGDVVMLSDDDEDSGEDLFVKDKRAPARKAATKAPVRAKSPVKKAPATRQRAPAKKQSTLSFASQASTRPTPRATASRVKKAQEVVS
jgi:double-strand break repair protein MRE11